MFIKNKIICFLPILRNFNFKELKLLKCRFPKKMTSCVRFWYKNKVNLFLSPEINIKLNQNSSHKLLFFALEELKAFSVCYFLRKGVSCVPF